MLNQEMSKQEQNDDHRAGQLVEELSQITNDLKSQIQAVFPNFAAEAEMKRKQAEEEKARFEEEMRKAEEAYIEAQRQADKARIEEPRIEEAHIEEEIKRLKEESRKRKAESEHSPRKKRKHKHVEQPVEQADESPSFLWTATGNTARFIVRHRWPIATGVMLAANYGPTHQAANVVSSVISNVCPQQVPAALTAALTATLQRIAHSPVGSSAFNGVAFVAGDKAVKTVTNLFKSHKPAEKALSKAEGKEEAKEEKKEEKRSHKRKR